MSNHCPNPALPADVRELDLGQRRTLRQQWHQAQTEWLDRLQDLVEPPPPDRDFPAFLLATEPLAGLRQAIGTAQNRGELAPVVADQVQHFVDAYRDYLRTTAGEDSFAGGVRRAG